MARVLSIAPLTAVAFCVYEVRFCVHSHVLNAKTFFIDDTQTILMFFAMERCDDDDDEDDW